MSSFFKREKVCASWWQSQIITYFGAFERTFKIKYLSNGNSQTDEIFTFNIDILCRYLKVIIYLILKNFVLKMFAHILPGYSATNLIFQLLYENKSALMSAKFVKFLQTRENMRVMMKMSNYVLFRCVRENLQNWISLESKVSNRWNFHS